MKRLITLIVCFILLPLTHFGQSSIFSEEKVDDMTGQIVRNTNWISLKKEMVKMYYSRLCQIDSIVFFDLKVSTGNVVSIDKDAKFILKFSDNSTMILYNYQYLISSAGQGAIGLLGAQAQGINPKFVLTKKQLETLAQKDIVKIRLYLEKGYIETKINKSKAQELKKHSVELFIRVYPS